MKKIIILVLGVAILGGAAYLYLSQDKKGANFDSVLPADPVAYFEVNRIEENLNRILATNFYTDLVNLDEGITPNGNPFKKFKVALESENELKPLRALLKHKAALSVYGLDMDFGKAMKNKTFPKEEIMRFIERFFLVIELDSSTKTMEKFVSTFKPFGKDVSAVEKVYNDHKYQSLTVESQELSVFYVRLNNNLVLAPSENSIHRAINVFSAQERSLADDADFQSARNTDLTDGFFYYDLQHLKSTFQKVFSALPDQTAKDKMNEQLEQYEGLNFVSGSYGWAEDLEVTSIVDYEISQINSEWQSFYKDCIGTKNPTLKYVPDQVLGYYWGGCIQWEKIIEGFQKGFNGTEKDATTANTVLTQIDPYMKMLGDNMGGYLVNIEEGMFPIPNLVLLIGLNDPAAVKAMIDPLTENNPMVRIEKVSHEGQEVSKLYLPINIITPGFAFIGNHLMIGTHFEQIQKAIDLSKGKGSSLAKNEFYQKIDLSPADLGNNVSYFEFGRLISKLLKFEDFSKGMMSQQVSKSKKKRTDMLNALDEAKQASAKNVGELKSLKDQFVALDDEIFLNETKGLDVSAQQSEMDDLESKITVLEGEIERTRAEEENNAAAIERYDARANSRPDMNKTVDNIAIPLLHVFKNLDALAGRVVVKGDTIETKVRVRIK